MVIIKSQTDSLLCAFFSLVGANNRMQCQVLCLLCALFSLFWAIVITLSQTVNVFGSLSTQSCTNAVVLCQIVSMESTFIYYHR